MYALALCLLLSVASQNPINKHASSTHEQSSSGAQANSEPTEGVSANGPSNQTTAQTKTEQYHANPDSNTSIIEISPQSESRWFIAYVIATFVIAAFNLGILILMWLQRGEMINQITEMENARKQDHEMAKLELRAWLKVEDIRAVVEPHTKVTGTVRIENVGKTPAKNSVAWMRTESLWHETRPNFSYSSEDAIHVQLGVAPGVLVFPIGLDDALIEEHARDITAELRRIYVHGRIEYKDVFNDPHWLEFCGIFDPGEKRFRMCDDHCGSDS